MRWLALLAAVLCHPLLAEDFPVLVDPALQRGMEQVVEQQGLSRAVADGRLALTLVQLNGNKASAMAALNPHRMMYAASLPKIAILYGAAVAIDQQRVENNARFQSDMVDMIRRSCNPCATRVLNAIGRDWLLELLQTGERPLYDPLQGGGLWVGKEYSPRPAYRRDPLGGKSHGATAWQAARFYWLLLRGDLASEASTTLMMEALSKPAITHKFVKGLAPQEELQLYRKSGTWRDFHADSALIMNGDEPCCILVGLAQDRRGGDWLERLALPMVELALRAMPDKP